MRASPTTERLHGFGLAHSSVARVWRPTSLVHASEILASAPGPLLARGSGHSYGDAALNGGGDVLHLGALVAPPSLDAPAGTILASAAATLRELLDVVVPRGWILPVIPGTAQATLGGAIAADVHGKNHHRDGSIADHLEWVQLLTADGEERRLFPGEDGFDATVGGNGLTGVIVEAQLRLQPLPDPWLHVDSARVADLDAALARLARSTRRYAVAWIDLLAPGRGRGVVTEADYGPAARPAPAPRARRVPTVARLGLRPRTMRAFNELRWRRSADASGRLETLDEHLCPLDGLVGWNRLYGGAGLLQYQFAVPARAAATVLEVCWLLAMRRLPVFLAVLKRLGPANGHGGLSFPIDGFTLALDLPAGLDGLEPALRRCDELVAEAGGRVYLTKDSRLPASMLAAMYPALARWREQRAALDPRERMRSDLGARLELCRR